WPLAQAAAAVGQGNVRVVDVVPAGQDPATFRLTPAAREQVRRAGLVIETGPSLQPSCTAAAAGAAHVVDVAPTGPAYPWLSPYRMEAVSRTIERALVAVDPAARSTFANGNLEEQALLSSLDEDYTSTLGDCPSQTMVTSDGAFTALGGRYQVRVVPVDGSTPAPLRPDAATIAREAATVRSAGVHKVYRDIWQPIDGLLPVEAEAGVTLATIDPLTGVPPGGWPRGARSYFDRMESNLETIAGALGCPNPGQGQ
ncbi:MAG: metal ABC transporter substrate-binding protein, partial [Acidimicrobiales bacterium]